MANLLSLAILLLRSIRPVCHQHFCHPINPTPCSLFPSRTLGKDENYILWLARSPDLTGRIRAPDVVHPRRLRASTPWDKWLHQGLDKPHLPPRVVEHKADQVFRARARPSVIKYQLRSEGDPQTNHLYRISSPKRLDFPLLIVRSANSKSTKWTHETPSLTEKCGWSTAQISGVLLDVHECLGEEILDLVDSRLQFSALEDRRRAIGRALGHGWLWSREWRNGDHEELTVLLTLPYQEPDVS